MAELTVAQQRILEAKRRAAEKRGEVFDMEKEAAAQAAKTPTQAKAQVEAQVEAVVAVEAQPEAVAAPAPLPAAKVEAATEPAPAAADRIAAAKASAAAKRPAPAGDDGPAAKPVSRPAKAPAPAAAQTAQAAAAEPAGQSGINRREFLTYAWGAALGLIAAQGGYATYDFMMPRFKEGEFGGPFPLDTAVDLPADGSPPAAKAAGKFWLVQSEGKVTALYMVCTHLGCLYKWEASNNRFECPCHGSKFTAQGEYIEGPAPRSLDQFVVEIVQNGEIVATTTNVGDAIVAPAMTSPTDQIVVQTGKKILGKAHG